MYIKIMVSHKWERQIKVAPLNVLYVPDHALWITERVGKDIVRIDPPMAQISAA
jgi:hypothetical protein